MYCKFKLVKLKYNCLSYSNKVQYDDLNFCYCVHVSEVVTFLGDKEERVGFCGCHQHSTITRGQGKYKCSIDAQAVN